MPHEVTATEVARNLSEYLNRVAYRGERFIIRRGTRSLAELAPISPPLMGSDLLALLASLPKIGLEELDSLEADIEAGRSALPVEEDKWST